MEEKDNLGDIFETTFTKWTSHEKRLKKKAVRRAHRGTNFKSLDPKKGYKRIKVPGSNRYVRIPLSPGERTTKKLIGGQLGRKGSLFK